MYTFLNYNYKYSLRLSSCLDLLVLSLFKLLLKLGVFAGTWFQLQVLPHRNKLDLRLQNYNEVGWRQLFIPKYEQLVKDDFYGAE